MSAMAHSGAQKMLKDNCRRRLLTYLMIPALWSCAAPIPQANFDPMDGASSISGIVRIIADEGFTNYSFHTSVKRRVRDCQDYGSYTKPVRSCQYQDVLRKVDIDIGSSSMQLFKD